MVCEAPRCRKIIRGGTPSMNVNVMIGDILRRDFIHGGNFQGHHRFASLLFSFLRRDGSAFQRAKHKETRHNDSEYCCASMLHLSHPLA